ncbi:MAG: HupE/UreJ family protein [Methylococcales bacterium]
MSNLMMLCLSTSPFVVSLFSPVMVNLFSLVVASLFSPFMVNLFSPVMVSLFSPFMVNLFSPFMVNLFSPVMVSLFRPFMVNLFSPVMVSLSNHERQQLGNTYQQDQFMKPIFLILLLSLFSVTALAHKPSDSYLTLSVSENQVQGQWHIALRDLDFAMALDSNDDGMITWAELKYHRTALFAYALQRLQLTARQQPCLLRPVDLLVDTHSDGHYAVLIFNAACPTQPSQLNITYQLFFDLDPQHRGLLQLRHHDLINTAIFSPDHNDYAVSLNATTKPQQVLWNFGYEGIWHIWIGYDHILFLISLLLPAALLSDGNSRQTKASTGHTCWDVFTVVTAFTLAHSITLSLAALGYISLPTRWVESAIAASVAIAALNNIFPLFVHKRTWFAFGFGLIHGMGIASVLLDMGLPDSQRLLALLGFNVGVEIGQLAIVSAVLPVIIFCSRYRYYPALIMKSASAAITVIALVWLMERSLDFQMNIF